MKVYTDCSDCPHISISEAVQSASKRKENHVCLLLNRPVLHGRSHPSLPVPDDCPFNSVEADVGESH